MTSSGQSIRSMAKGTPRTVTPTPSVIAAPIAPTPIRATPRPKTTVRKSLGLT